MPDMTFPVEKAIYDGFTEGETYTLYYVTIIPYLRHLVAAEYHPTTPEKQK